MNVGPDWLIGCEVCQSSQKDSETDRKWIYGDGYWVLEVFIQGVVTLLICIQMVVYRRRRHLQDIQKDMERHLGTGQEKDRLADIAPESPELLNSQRVV